MDSRREILSKLKSQLIAIAVHAKHGNTLIGVGEAVDALDRLSEGRCVDVSVQVSIGFRVNGESAFACVDVDEDGLRLSTLHTGHTLNYDLDWIDFGQWLASLREILNLGGTTLIVSRNHL